MKSIGEELAQKLSRNPKRVWDSLDKDGKEQIFSFADGYKKFLNQAKTERQALKEIKRELQAHGFVSLMEIEKEGIPLSPGRRWYFINRNKALVAGVMGREPVEKGLRLIGAHLDTPRLDLKPNPLYESHGMAFFKTHYYGGIKKYQWTALPLALHGVVIKEDGEKIEISLGEKEDEPVFTITDLLPHLSKDQLERKLKEGIAGEELNVLVGSIPFAEDREFKERVKLAVLQLLHRRYGLKEEDFISAELELVPAGRARDVGFDRSLIGAYGHDDRVCVYTAVKAITQLEKPYHTAVVVLADKEEVGSAGNTGMRSRFFEHVILDLLRLSGFSTDKIMAVLYRTKALSADVNAAEDPTWQEAFDKLNSARLGQGVVLTKYTGARGKYNTNDAHAEFLGEIRRLFNQKGIVWQTGELGKVDQGGGGTIAQFLADYGMDVLDCGPPVLSMHSPMEIVSKADVYMTYKAYQVFWDSSTF
ncbi:aminopeptidase [Calderihabitans maritimus]|uniref:M18 family aminopeptidase n=1 Tax=Calderihabitans maritimus TaxID=1246530 RepID=A0A1Z5HVY8_9FIRM|nr:aminopeptidase [Calderihabitans maritimus]GAW93702.1 peptidase M18 aminopeptidase I [Calderihabitans maritimus]